jgi:hypothetical protein
MKVNNKVINGQRDVQNELGRKVMKKKITTEEIDNLPDKPEEDGDGDEYNEEEDVPTQATSSTPIRTPVHRRDAAGSRAASSAYKTGPTSSAKRKKPLRSSAGNDGDDDDDGDYHPTALVTPTHRPVTRRRTAIVPSPTLRASSNDDDDENSGASNAGSLPSRRQPARRASNTSCRPSAGRRSAGRRSTNSSNPDPSTAVSELDLKKILCEILKVPADLATQYSLSDLRIYARAYNQAFVQQPWFQDDAPGFTGVGYAMHSEHGPTYHFAQVLHQLRDLAIARQDLNSDGTCNDDAPYMSGFYTNGDALQDQALGVAFNGFGLHPQYQTMSLQVQQSSPYSQMQQFSPYSSGPQFSPSSQGPQFSQDPQIAQLSTYSQNPQFSQEPQISQFSLYFEGP